jgi:hypothetical protein
LPVGEEFLIYRQVEEPPWTKFKSLQAKIERVLEKAVLDLEMLRSQKRALGPENWL